MVMLLGLCGEMSTRMIDAKKKFFLLCFALFFLFPSQELPMQRRDLRETSNHL